MKIIKTTLLLAATIALMAILGGIGSYSLAYVISYKAEAFGLVEHILHAGLFISTIALWLGCLAVIFGALWLLSEIWRHA